MPHPDYEIRRFRAALDGVGEDARADAVTRAWIEAVDRGFHENPPVPGQAERATRFYLEDDRELTGAYLTGTADRPDGAVDPEVPVATFGTMRHTLNTGAELLPTHQITAVTVRATHRRRGLLRRMMTEDLRRAADAGLAMAALTASEATIYGRFGFGVAVERESLRIDTRRGLSMLTGAAGTAGTTEFIEREAIAGISRRVFAAWHAVTPGSMDRQASYPGNIDGTLREADLEPDTAVRAAAHWDPDGEPDGYVTWKFAGWDADPTTVRIRDFVAVTDDAYRALWDLIGSLDLVDVVTWDRASVDEPLRWTVADTRTCAVTEREDSLWLRVLDPVAALQARPGGAPGTVRIGVTDDLDIAAGTFDVVSDDGRLTVHRVADDSQQDAEVTLSVAALGSAYLGGISVTTLARAGAVQGEPAAVQLLGGMLATGRVPQCITGF
ncbi:GNAT family N-acetyltransferase [Tersicoccus sp. MR15.9]|uniref:GNAT family N-acetyltransferase n=1 Tax=Tersicoccus mangrovi TaxID=3121635 RepID=UPI002FE6080B